MTVQMNWNDATFKLSDVIKLCVGLVTVVIFAITMQGNLSFLTDRVQDIRDTQVDNTKKNDLRWEAIGLEINALKMNQSLLEQRIKALEQRSNNN